MGIILKHTFKNIFHKPGRTLLMTFCIFLCSLAASLCLDISNSMERIFASSMGDFAGSTDILYKGITPVDDEFFSILPENYTLKLNSIGQNFYKRDPEMYSYAVQYCMSVYGMDLDDAKKMNVISDDLNPGLHEVIITEDMAELLEVSEGDTLTFYDLVGNEHNYVISKLVPIGGFFNNKESAIVSYESQLELTCGTDNVYTLYIDIIDDSLINDTEELLKEKYPEATIMNIRNLDLLKDAIKNITQLMTTMFAMCLLVVVIINITVSERIMNERMSVVGTLRSLDVSQTGTALILLLENVLYALMGSIPGILLYSIIRDPMYSFLMSTVGMTSNIGTLSVSIKFTVILASVVIQCICTLKEVIKASRTAIRDIIFLNKDTEFRFSKLKTVSGIIMLTASVALAFIQESFVAQICCFVFSLIGVFILKYVGEDENDLRYVLCGIGEDGSFSPKSDKVYTYLQVMNGYCYIMGEFSDNTEALLFERDGIWGYVSRNGEEIMTFDDAAGFVDSEYAPVYQDGSFYLIDKQMNRVSEDIDCEYANSLGSDLFFITKDGVNCIATYVTPEDGAYDSAATTENTASEESTASAADAPDESSDIPHTGNACAAVPLLAVAGSIAALSRKRR